MLDLLDGGMEEKRGGIRKLGGGLGRKEMAGASFGELSIHLRMAGEVIDQADGYTLSLGKEGDRLGQEGAYLTGQEGIMGATQDQGIDQRIGLQQVIEVLTDEIVGSGRVELVVLDQGDPHRAGLSRDLDMGEELANLNGIRMGGDGAGGAHNADMLASADAIHTFDRWTDHAQHPSIGIPCGQIALLDGAKRLCGGRVASQDDQLATGLKQVAHGLASKLIDHLERAHTIGGPGVIS